MRGLIPAALFGALALPGTGLTPWTATALAGALLAGALVLALARRARPRLPAVLPLIRRTSALRAKAWRTAFLRQRDPDGAGRARPRAPSAGPAAAAF